MKIPVPPKECFSVVFWYLNTSKNHPNWELRVYRYHVIYTHMLQYLCSHRSSWLDEEVFRGPWNPLTCSAALSSCVKATSWCHGSELLQKLGAVKQGCLDLK